MASFFVYTPLCWIRNLEALNATHILADFIIAFTMVICVVYSSQHISDQGGLGPNLQTINPNTYLNIIGFSVYVYEGIGIVLPVKEITSD